MIYFFLNQYRALNVRIDLTYKSKFVKKTVSMENFYSPWCGRDYMKYTRLWLHLN